MSAETSNQGRVLMALVLDTFREAFARWLFWGLFGLSTLLILFFLFVLKIDVVQGAVSLFGLERSERHVYDIQKFVRLSYAWVATFLYVWGTFLALFASGGLISAILEPGRIALLVSKPVTRTMLLAGRFLGNLLIVLANCTYLIAGIWIIIGSKTGIWDGRFLLAIPVSLFIFTVLLCVVVLVGVISESPSLAVMISVALMLISAILAQREVVVKLLSSEWSRSLWLALYWVLPKVYDLGASMRETILRSGQAVYSAPLWTSTAFAFVVLSTAVLVFSKRDF